MNQTSGDQYEELSINTVEGLRQFLENAQAQYRAGLSVTSSADFEQSEQLDEVFNAVRRVAKRLIIDVSKGKAVDHADAAELQQKYDRMIAFLQQATTKQKTEDKQTTSNPDDNLIVETSEVTKQTIAVKNKDDSESIKPSSTPNEKKKPAEQSKLRKQVDPESRQVQPASTELKHQVKESGSKLKSSNSKSDETIPKKQQADLANALKKLDQRSVKNEESIAALQTTKSESREKYFEQSSKLPEEAISLKPKTGILSIKADKSEKKFAQKKAKKPVTVLDENSSNRKSETTESRVEVPEQQNEDHIDITVSAPEASNKLLAQISQVEQLSTRKVKELQLAHPDPNPVQQLLYDEVEEGLAYLAEVKQVVPLSSETEKTILQVVAHISHALQSISETAAIRVTEREDDTYDRVPIVTEQVQVTIKSAENNIIPSPVSFVPSSVTAKKDTVVKRTIPKPLQTLPKPASVYETESLTDLYLTAPADQEFIIENYSSTKEFERLLDATITEIEASTIDSVERWLGDLPASAFAFIKDSYVSDLISFGRRPYAEIAADLATENVKYETFAEWRDMIDDMLLLVPGGKSMKYGQLFARWMLEVAKEDYDQFLMSLE